MTCHTGNNALGADTPPVWELQESRDCVPSTPAGACPHHASTRICPMSEYVIGWAVRRAAQTVGLASVESRTFHEHSGRQMLGASLPSWLIAHQLCSSGASRGRGPFPSLGLNHDRGPRPLSSHWPSGEDVTSFWSKRHKGDVLGLLEMSFPNKRGLQGDLVPICLDFPGTPIPFSPGQRGWLSPWALTTSPVLFETLWGLQLQRHL